MGFNVYSQRTRATSEPIQVWDEVKGVKGGGGTISGADKLPEGFVIPAGTPVYLDKAGGELIAIHTYEIAEGSTATAPEYVINGYTAPQVGDNLIAEGGTTASDVVSVVANSDGTFNVVLTATLGDLAEGDILIEANEDGEILAKPNGLLWHDIVIEEGTVVATGACVDVGRIYEDRINAIPADFKAGLPGINFEKGI